MSENTETIQIIIDDSGVSSQVRNVTNEINKIGDSADDANKKLTSMGDKIEPPKNLREISKELELVSGAAKLTEEQVNKLADRMRATAEQKALENALRSVADAAGMTTKEYRALMQSVYGSAGGPPPAISRISKELETVAGAAKLTERQIEDLHKKMQDAQGQKTLSDALRAVGDAAGMSRKELKDLAEQTGLADKELKKLSGAAGLLVRTLPLVGTAVAAINLTGLISESTQLAARYETLGVVMNVVGKNAGYTSTEMERFDKSLQKTGISMAESRNNLAKMASANIDLANATKLARIAQDAAVIGNTNSSQAFQSLIYGIQSAQVEVLRTIGLNVNFEQSYKKLADQLGKTSNELTEAEKTQARLNAVMEKAPSIAGAYEASMDTVGKKLGSTERLAENAKTMLGALFLPTWTAAVDAYSDALVRVNEELERIDVGKVQLLGRAIADVFKQGNPAAATPGGFMFEVWLNYKNQAEASNVAVEKSFVDTWGEIERAGMNYVNTFIASEDQRKAAIQKSNEEILESFRKLNQTQIEKLDEQRESFLKAGASKADVDKWYNAERAKLEEAATKKHSAELKKQVSASKKAREEMLKGSKSAEKAIDDYWQDYENRRVAAIANSAAQTVKLRVDAEKEAADAATAILEKQQAEAEKVMDNIQDATAGVFYDLFSNIEDGWSNLWDSMKSWALRTLAELAARAATVQIIVPIMTSMTGTANATQAVQAITGGGGGFGNLPFGSIMGGEGGMFSGLTSSINAWGASTFPNTFTGGVALAGPTQSGAPLVSTGPSLMGTMGSVAGIAGGVYQMSQGGTGNTVAGAGTAIGSGLMMVPGWGTVAGAIVIAASQIAGAIIGNEKVHSPSVIFQEQTKKWGETTGTQYHLKSGGKEEIAKQITEQLDAIFETSYATVDALLSGLGDGYAEQLKDATVTWGRKSGGLWKEWDFGSDMDMTQLLNNAAADIQHATFEAAAGALTKVGQDLAAKTEVADLLGELSEKPAVQFQKLIDVVAKGAEEGKAEEYANHLMQLHNTLNTMTAVWDDINQQIEDLINPPSDYELKVRSTNKQFDEWTATLKSLGFNEEKVKEVEEKRQIVLDGLTKSIADLTKAEQDMVNARKDELAARRAKEDAEQKVYQERLDAYEKSGEDFQKLADALLKAGDAAGLLKANIARALANPEGTYTAGGREYKLPYGMPTTAEEYHVVERLIKENSEQWAAQKRDYEYQQDLMYARMARDVNANVSANMLRIMNAGFVDPGVSKLAEYYIGHAMESLSSDLRGLVGSVVQASVTTSTWSQFMPAGPGLAEIGRVNQEIANTKNEMLAVENSMFNLNRTLKQGIIDADTYARGMEAVSNALPDAYSAYQELQSMTYEERLVAQEKQAAAEREMLVNAGIRSANYYFSELNTMVKELGEAAQAANTELGKLESTMGYLKSFADAFGFSAKAASGGAYQYGVEEMYERGQAYQKEIMDRMESFYGKDSEQYAHAKSGYDYNAALIASTVQASLDAIPLIESKEGRNAAIVAEAAKKAMSVLTTRSAAAMAEELKKLPAFADLLPESLRDMSLLMDGIAQYDAEGFLNAFYRISDALNTGTINAEQFAQMFDLSLDVFENGIKDAAKKMSAQDLADLWEKILQASMDLVSPPTDYEMQVRQTNEQYKEWIDTLKEAGAEQEKLTLLEEHRVTVLENLAKKQAVSTAESDLQRAYQKEQSELQQTSDRFKMLAKQLEDWRTAFWSGTDSPLDFEQRTEMLYGNFRMALEKALSGDEDAFGKLAGDASSYLQAAKENASTREDYARIAGGIAAQMKEAEKAAEGQKSVADKQLEALTTQVNALLKIDESVLSIGEAINNLARAQQALAAAQAARAAADLAAAQAAATAAKETSVKGYASGGYHTGGLRIVGERGPELESTGASRIWSADETRDILMGGSNNGVVIEIQKLREDMAAANYAIAKNTAATANMLGRWDGDGMPEERAM